MTSQEMIENLLPTRDAENGSACMKCMNPNANLVRCSACRRVMYCRPSCQRNDWREHKPVCKIMQVFKDSPHVSLVNPEVRKANFHNNVKRFNALERAAAETGELFDGC